MKVLVRANEQQKQELLQHACSNTIEFNFYYTEIVEADLYIDCLFEEDKGVFDTITDKPILVGCLLKTSNQLPANYIRINTWFGSLLKTTWEFACINESLKSEIEDFCLALDIKPIFVDDTIGLIVAPTISMIINEAYFALSDRVSTKQDIDIAMKLGTNYPFGPFEWGEKIGLKKVFALLNALQIQNTKYTPCPLLTNESLA